MAGTAQPQRSPVLALCCSLCTNRAVLPLTCCNLSKGSILEPMAKLGAIQDLDFDLGPGYLTSEHAALYTGHL